MTEVKEQTITVGLGEACVNKDPSTVLACYGLGSCISLCAYDPVSRVGGMAHIVLPESDHADQNRSSAKFADIAVPLLLNEMYKYGAVKSRLVVKLVGGSQMLSAAIFNSVLDMGARNLEMTKKALASENIRPAATDIGGSQGRSVWLFVDSGKVRVRTAGLRFSEL